MGSGFGLDIFFGAGQGIGMCISVMALFLAICIHAILFSPILVALWHCLISSRASSAVFMALLRLLLLLLICRVGMSSPFQGLSCGVSGQPLSTIACHNPSTSGAHIEPHGDWPHGPSFSPNTI